MTKEVYPTPFMVDLKGGVRVVVHALESLSVDVREAVTLLFNDLAPGPVAPDEVWRGIAMIAWRYPEIATLDAIPWLVEMFEPLLKGLEER